MEGIKFMTACALVEDKAAEIYHAMALAARAQGDEELGVLWQEMAVDEESHAQQVRLATRLSREKIFARLKPEDEGAPFALMERAEAMLAQVKSGSLNELEMLQIAVELEKHFRRIHTTYTLLFEEVSMKKMFDALARADSQHMAGLKDRIKRFTGKPS